MASSGADSAQFIANVLAQPDDETAADSLLDLDWQLGFIHGQPAAGHLARLAKSTSMKLPDDARDTRALQWGLKVLSAAFAQTDRCVWKADLPARNRVRSSRPPPAGTG